jgi:hypothetical protein
VEKKQKQTIDKAMVNTFLENTTGSSVINKAAYLIIPVDQGCSSCISKSLLFARDKMNEDKLGIVLSSFSSKEIKRILLEHFQNDRSVDSLFILDSKSFARSLGVSAFPMILYAGGDGVESILLNAENIDAELASLSERMK